MATQGLVPFCNVYSTFLQRAYDQIIHDVALQQLPVIFCLDRAGIVGKDGATHHGVFDLAYLNCIPDMIIAAPMDAIEMRNMMFTASQGLELPMAIRYPRGRGKIVQWKQPFKQVEIGSSRWLKKGKNIAIVSIGPIGTMIQELLDQENLNCTHIDMRFLKPIDDKALDDLFDTHKHIITIEDGTVVGGLGSAVCDLASAKAYQGKIHKLGIPDEFMEHGPTADLHKIAGIDCSSTLELIKSLK